MPSLVLSCKEDVYGVKGVGHGCIIFILYLGTLRQESIWAGVQ